VKRVERKEISACITLWRRREEETLKAEGRAADAWPTSCRLPVSVEEEEEEREKVRNACCYGERRRDPPH